MRTTTLVARPLDPEPADRLMVAVIDLSHSAEPVLAQLAIAGPAYECRVKPALLAPRVGFSTDAALVARAHRRLRADCDEVLAALQRHVPPLVEPADLVWYARTPLGRPVEQARRAARRATRAYGAHEVILPPHLRNDVGDQPTA